MKKSQTATEYLIILAVVIVIALVVVNTMGGFPGIGAGTSKKVSDVKLSMGTIGIDSYSIGANSSIFKLKNNNYDTITVTEFRLNQQTNLTCNSSNTVPSLPIVLNIGQSMIVNCSVVNSSNYVITDRQTPVVGFLYTDSLGATRTAGNVQSYDATNSGGAQSLSSSKSILSFNITSPVSVVGVINETNHSILISVPFGTVVTAMNTSINVSDLASINLSSGIVVDFTSPVNYTVTAQDGSSQNYTVSVNVALNSAKAITAFSFASPSVNGIVTELNRTILLTVPFLTNVTSLVPNISTTGNSVSPASGVARDFTSPVSYTVTAADGSTQNYVVTVVVGAYQPGMFQTTNGFMTYIYTSNDFGATWTQRGLNLSWFAVAMSSDGSKQTAVGTLANGNIYVSNDYGNTWVPKETNRSFRGVAMSSDGVKQTVTDYTGGYLYISNDSGNTWSAKGSNLGWYGVAMSSDGVKQTAGNANGNLYISNDSGNTWVVKGISAYWRGIAMSSDGTKQVAVSAVSAGKIYTSNDSGNTWVNRTGIQNMQSVAMSSDGTKITAGAVTGKLYVSNDSGVTFINKTSVNENWYAITMSSDGTKQVATTYAGLIYNSNDSGNTWTLFANTGRTLSGFAMSR